MKLSNFADSESMALTSEQIRQSAYQSREQEISNARERPATSARVLVMVQSFLKYRATLRMLLL